MHLKEKAWHEIKWQKYVSFLVQESGINSPIKEKYW